MPQPSTRLSPTLLLPLSAAFAALVFSWLGPLAFPLRLLTTIIHELSHGLAAIMTGGEFLRFVVFPDGSGLAYTRGGVRFLIIPAGYVGTALFGAGLIMLGRYPRASRITLGIIGAALVGLTLRFALPTVFSPQILGGLLTLVAGVSMGALLLYVAWQRPERWSLWLLNLLAFWVGLSAIGDLVVLFRITTTPGLTIQSDAHAMAAITFLPAVFWAVLWVLMALFALGWALWRTWLRR
ncbi:MAG: M50 family metallopeptidase [Oscillochloridaceae bacterium umkhey_bin13]